jgi:hypothetical protein
MAFKIIGTYRGQRETIDTASTRKEAEYLRAEYQMAYGREWSIAIQGVGKDKTAECGCCGAYHRADFHGDCREDSERHFNNT